MFAVCRAFKHYERVSPDDEWLAKFRCYDGLIIEPCELALEEEVAPDCQH